MKTGMKETQFDRFAGNYERELEKGLAISGETQDYFAAGRVDLLRHQITERGLQVRQILDYGCGTGNSIPFLLTIPNVVRVVGVDVSRESIEVARSRYHGLPVEFMTTETELEAGTFDLVFCNGVFHHIHPSDRPRSMDYIRRSLKGTGHFALWENNPWNPGTRYVMSRIEFDRDAVTLSPRQGRQLLQQHGFRVVGQRFAFFFPRFLKFLRPLECRLGRLPIGAQYLTLGAKAE